MKILLIILVLTIATMIISKVIFESHFIGDITGLLRLEYLYGDKEYLSGIILTISKILIFFEVIIIAIMLIISKI